MKVSDLMNQLEACDPDTDVKLFDSFSLESFQVDEVDFENSCEGQILLTFNN